MIKTKLFMNNKTQAVRLPKAVEMPKNTGDVSIICVGNTRIISPIESTWDQWFDDNNFSDDFMVDREQPPEQVREPFND